MLFIIMMTICRIILGLVFLVMVSCVSVAESNTRVEKSSLLTASAKKKIAQQIWKNESAGTIEGLVSWNEGEDFASVGIGHFIWFPKGKTFRFEEKFPRVLRFFVSRGVKLPSWLSVSSSCPWNNRTEFLADKNGKLATDLRGFLASTVELQSEFLFLRLENALPKILQSAHPNKRAVLEGRFRAVSMTSNGIYALVDYVNFKGEGIKLEERYKGQGWGMLQVLQNMKGKPVGQSAAKEFSDSARRTLERRIQNAPRDESRWRAGWNNRVATYARPF